MHSTECLSTRATAKTRSPPWSSVRSVHAVVWDASSLDAFIPLFSVHQASLLTFLAILVERPDQPAVVADTLLALYLAPDPPRDQPPAGKPKDPYEGETAEDIVAILDGHKPDDAEEVAVAADAAECIWQRSRPRVRHGMNCTAVQAVITVL